MYKDYIIKLVKEIIKDKEIVVETPPKPNMGDYSVPCFNFRDETNKNPLEISKMIKENFKVKFIQGVDLFPYTYHIESVCVLERQI